MIKLIIKPESNSSPSVFYLTELYQKHFELTTDLNSDGLIYAKWQDYNWAVEQNRPGIVDHLWDPHLQDLNVRETNNLKVLYSDGWFDLANEPLMYKALNLDQITANSDNTKTFLLLMNNRRPHRDFLWSKVQPLLTNAIYSYQGIGVPLKGGDDIDPRLPDWQRHVNPDWYNSTKFSLVVESQVDSNPNGTPLDPSEKSLKPFAFKHPMIVWAAPGTLAWLRSWGFETFDNCIDESYDLEPDRYKRLAMILKEVERLNATPQDYFETAETQRRLDVNYNRFYDINWATQQLEERVFNVIKAYGATHGFY